MDVAHHPPEPNAPGGETAIPPVFAVVGENRDDPDRLLLLGDDGRHYQYQLTDGTTLPVVPDEAWVIDADSPHLDSSSRLG